MRTILIVLIIGAAACTSQTTVTATAPTTAPTYSPAYTATVDPVVTKPEKCVRRSAVSAALGIASAELQTTQTVLRYAQIGLAAKHVRRAAAAYGTAAKLLKDYPSIAREESGASKELYLSANALESGQIQAATAFLSGGLAHVNAATQAIKTVGHALNPC